MTTEQAYEELAAIVHAAIFWRLGLRRDVGAIGASSGEAALIDLLDAHIQNRLDKAVTPAMQKHQERDKASFIIHAAIDGLRRAAAHDGARKWLTESDRALLALADLVDQTVTAIDGQAKREMTCKQLHLIEDLRAAVPCRKDVP
jgi:hypothetical protein